MKIHPHHIDLVQKGGKIFTSFEERMSTQLEMIQDHAWLNHLSIEEAILSWTINGWAKRFAEHYFLKK